MTETYPADVLRDIQQMKAKIYDLERRIVNSGAGSNVGEQPPILVTSHLLTNSMTNPSVDGDNVAALTFDEFGGTFGADGNWVSVGADGYYSISVWGFINGQTTPNDGQAEIVIRTVGGPGSRLVMRTGVPYGATSPYFTLTWLGFIGQDESFGIRIYKSGGSTQFYVEATQFG